MTAAEQRLHERAARLPVKRDVGLRTWRVQSGSDSRVWYIVRGAEGDTFDGITCNCYGGRGRCAHRIALANRLNIPIPGPAERRRPATQTPTSSSLVGDPAAVLGAVAGSTEGVDDTTTGGTMPQDVGVHGTTVIFIGAIADRSTAVQASGKIEGGGNLALDIPDDGHIAEIIGALTAMRRMPLRVTIEPVKKNTPAE